MIKTKFKGQPVRYSDRRVSKKVIPNQSMTMREILERFMKGLPLDVKEKPKIYIDQIDHDFEKMSGLDPTEKAYQATEFRAQSETLSEELKAKERAKDERKRKAEIDAAVSKAKAETPKADPPKEGSQA